MREADGPCTGGRTMARSCLSALAIKLMSPCLYGVAMLERVWPPLQSPCFRTSDPRLLHRARCIQQEFKTISTHRVIDDVAPV
jgi:hypothetical protein